MQLEKSQLTMIPKKLLYVFLLILQVQCYCNALLCRTTNDHKNHTCEGATFHQIVISRSTRLGLLRERIYNCKETEIKEAALFYPKLENLTISCGTIKTVHKNAFLNFNNLQELDLSGNALHEFGADIFEPLGNLKTLNLSYNSFKDLTQFTFKGLNNLKDLIASHNEITNFDLKVFDSVKNLVMLYLNSNKIDFLPVRLLTKLRKLQYIDLSNNFINEFGEAFVLAYNLRYLNLSYNSIEDLPLRAFQTTRLEVLDLSNNKLTVIYEDALPLKTLKELYFQNNQITLIDIKAFNMIDLPLHLFNTENNKLVFLEPEFLEAFKNVKTLKLNRNPWDCGCWAKIEKVLSHAYRNLDDDGPLCVVGPTPNCQIDRTNLELYYNLYIKQID